jgi:glycine hydroxymethyltransferase
VLKNIDSDIFSVLQDEEVRQKSHLELIASENFVSPAVLETMGSVLTNKYAEGYPGARYYGGCDVVDRAENLAIERAKLLFGCEYVNVQPHSGSQANLAVYMTYLQPNDVVLGMNLAHGGHLTHGSPVNFSGKQYTIVAYGVEKETGLIDMADVRAKAREHRPKMIIAGGSAYSRHYDFAAFREIADEVGAVLWADIAHPAGLVAAGLHPSPIPYCDVVTTTTHKTLRGPRGGMIMVGKDTENKLGVIAPKSGRVKMMSELFNSTVMPGIQGGPLMHIIAAKAVAFGEALKPEFNDYGQRVIDNARYLADALMSFGFKIVSGGTDNHLLLVDLSNKGLTGKEAELRLQNAGITVNKNMVPFDTKSPFVTSGIRLGTAAMTTRGFSKQEMKQIAIWIHDIIRDENHISRVLKDVESVCQEFPLFAETV